MKVYISGPMTGIPEFNYPAFHAAEAAWAAAGWEVLNPARNPDGLSWAEYMRLDIAMVLRADMLVTLPGWEASRGAQLEWTIATALDIPVADAEVVLPASIP